jgi:hypothetical protein
MSHDDATEAELRAIFSHLDPVPQLLDEPAAPSPGAPWTPSSRS